MGIFGDEDGVGSKHPCGICLLPESEAKYLCSRCRIRYCSLNCFKSPNHNSCSEAFYAKQVKESMSVPKMNEKDKLRLISVLDKYQGDDWKYESPLNYNKIENELELQRDDLDEDDRELTFEEEKELYEQINNATPDQLLKFMTPDERKRFEKMVEKYDIIDE